MIAEGAADGSLGGGAGSGNNNNGLDTSSSVSDGSQLNGDGGGNPFFNPDGDADVNCDKMGTCYDGKVIREKNKKRKMIGYFSLYSSSSLQRYEDCGQCRYQQTLQRKDLRLGPLRDLQR